MSFLAQKALPKQLIVTFNKGYIIFLNSVHRKVWMVMSYKIIYLFIINLEHYLFNIQSLSKNVNDMPVILLRAVSNALKLSCNSSLARFMPRLDLVRLSNVLYHSACRGAKMSYHYILYISVCNMAWCRGDVYENLSLDSDIFLEIVTFYSFILSQNFLMLICFIRCFRILTLSI